MKSLMRAFGASILFVTLLSSAHGMSVALQPSIPSPASLGQLVTWNAAVSSADTVNFAYAFRVRQLNGPFRTVVDFGPNSSLDWTTLEQEGAYEIEVSAKNKLTNEVVKDTQLFSFNPLVAGDTPVVTPTANPLVFIYSAPSCKAGSRLRVAFKTADSKVQNTPWSRCHSGMSMNFYLAGLLTNTTYTANHTLDSGSEITSGPPVSFTTSDPFMDLPSVTPLSSGKIPAFEGILLHSNLDASATATDLAGNLVWYGPADITFLTSPQAGGTFLGIGQDGMWEPSLQFFREFDLAGVTVAETNAARVNEQLAALGMRPINGFHHDARKLPGGGYLVLANSERILTDEQGPGPVDVIGDTILVLDSNLRVTWGWDSFDHLNTSRTATLRETCTASPGLACPPFHLTKVANDWLHGNSVELTPDGNILYSARNQDWVLKISYDNGVGDGSVLWKLGEDGDFQIASSDPHPWFSHQHDASFEKDNLTITLFDNGNVRAAADPTALSRGQVLTVDEKNRTATEILNVNLGVYSPAVGSAQKLLNGHYHFEAGFVLDPDGSGNRIAQSVEVDSTGKIVYGIQMGTIEYRTFRMRDLYTAP